MIGSITWRSIGWGPETRPRKRDRKTIWPDIGALMLGLFVVPAAGYFHRFWTVDDPVQRRTQALAFYRNVEIMGASLVMFGLFGWVGHGLRFAMTGPLTRW